MSHGVLSLRRARMLVCARRDGRVSLLDSRQCSFSIVKNYLNFNNFVEIGTFRVERHIEAHSAGISDCDVKVNCFIISLL